MTGPKPSYSSVVLSGGAKPPDKVFHLSLPRRAGHQATGQVQNRRTIPLSCSGGGPNPPEQVSHLLLTCRASHQASLHGQKPHMSSLPSSGGDQTHRSKYFSSCCPVGRAAKPLDRAKTRILLRCLARAGDQTRPSKCCTSSFPVGRAAKPPDRAKTVIRVDILRGWWTKPARESVSPLVAL